jgi:hypothetical protein
MDASRESLLVYWLHLIVIFGMFWKGHSLAGIIGMTMNVIETIGATFLLIVLMILAAKFWGLVKKKYPKYSSLFVKVAVAVLTIMFFIS